MNPLGQLPTQLQQLWARMSPGWRTLVALAVLGSTVGVVAVGWYSQQTDYQPVFTGLALEDVGAITSKLTAQGIPYRLAGAGTSVLVAADQVQQVRVSMSVEGLPSKGGGKGYDLFDQTSFGMTPFTQHINHLRAQQNEIARTIAQIDPVVAARVHITRPEPSPFIRSEKATTASVMVKLRAGATLPRQVGAGIAAFVAKSVEGLAKENVTLMDTNGRVLFQELAGDEGAMSSHLDYRRDLESYLAGKAESMLANVLGPGKANVRVNAEVSLKSNHERKETYQPDKVVQSESLTTTKSTGTEGSKASTTGTSANLGKGTSAGGTKESNNITENIDTKYALSKVIQEIDDKMGAVQRLTIAAFVELPPPSKEGDSLTLAKVNDIIKNAVGFKTDRDEITVTQTRFAEPKLPTIEPETPAPPVWVNWLDIIRNASIALAALVTCVLGISLVRRGPKATPATAAAAVAADEPADVLRFQRLTQALERNPEALAKVLDNWLRPPGGSPPAAAA